MLMYMLRVDTFYHDKMKVFEKKIVGAEASRLGGGWVIVVAVLMIA